MRFFKLKIINVVFCIFTISQSYAEKSFNERFNEFLQEAPALKDVALKKSAEHKVEDKIDGYTANPAQGSHYREGQLDTIEMERLATKEASPSGQEDLNKYPGKIVTHSFQTRPVVKIDKNDPIIKTAKEIENNPEAHARIAVDSQANCQKKKVKHCTTVSAIEKKCNEQLRALQKICEHQPKVVIKDLPYPGCQKRVRPNGREECLIGRFDIGSHQVVIPKFRAARVEVAGSRHGYFYVSAKNETTGNIIYQHAHMDNGISFDIAPSGNRDETYTLVAERSDGCNCQWPGYLTLYIDNQAKEPVVESWEEINCHEI